jgi:hypothetical protein
MKRCYSAYLQYLTLHAIASCVLTTTMAAVPAVSMIARAASITILRMFLSSVGVALSRCWRSSITFLCQWRDGLYLAARARGLSLIEAE